MELKNKLYGEYIDSIVSKLKGKGLQNQTRAALYTMLEEYYKVAIENKATPEEAVRSAIVNMGDAEELIKSIKEQHKDHLAIGITIAFACVVVGFFAVMIPLTHFEVIKLFGSREVIAVIAISLVVALALSVYRFTLQKLLKNLKFGACIAGISYFVYRTLAILSGNMSENLILAEYIRHHITQMCLVIVYAIAVFAVADALERRLFPNTIRYIRNIFLERDHLRVKGRFRGKTK